MISRIEGELVAVEDGHAELRCDHLFYRILLPSCDRQRLSTMIGERIEFYTLHYLENVGQGAAYVPRFIGFATTEDRAFFEMFTTVKGLGNRKALRALQLPFATVAHAIAAQDIDLLTSLPEIGKRTAQTIVAELHGKVDRFIEMKPTGAGVSGGFEGEPAIIADAVTVLSQLGEARVPARQLAERALRADPTIDTADALVAAAFRLKESG